MQANQWESVTWNKSGHRQNGVSKTTQVLSIPTCALRIVCSLLVFLQLNKAYRSGNVTATKKYGAGGNQQGGTHLNTKKLDDDHDTLKHKTVSLGLKKLLQQERGKAKMTQKDMATAMNDKPQIIQDYEAGRGIPNPQILSKMERVLKQKNPEFVLGTLTKAQKGAGKKKKAPVKKRQTKLIVFNFPQVGSALSGAFGLPYPVN